MLYLNYSSEEAPKTIATKLINLVQALKSKYVVIFLGFQLSIKLWSPYFTEDLQRKLKLPIVPVAQIMYCPLKLKN